MERAAATLVHKTTSRSAEAKQRLPQGVLLVTRRAPVAQRERLPRRRIGSRCDCAPRQHLQES